MGWHFYPRTPCGVRRIQPNQWYKAYGISIHVPRAGYDPEQLIACDRPGHFYPRTPCGVRPTRFAPIFRLLYISIHVPRAGYDPRRPDACKPGQDISIHVPRAGYDEVVNDYGAATQAFLSTYPVRGTTSGSKDCRRYSPHFYPRTPCGVRHMLEATTDQFFAFLSTYPVRGTTADYITLFYEDDYFYPRTPCGVRPASSEHAANFSLFLSTYPVRGTTYLLKRSFGYLGISIHVPRAGYDAALSVAGTALFYFYPRTPCGVRHVDQNMDSATTAFLSTYPVRGTTFVVGGRYSGKLISIHVPRAGYDTQLVLLCGS